MTVNREMNEKMIASKRQKQQLDLVMKIGVKNVNILII